MRCLGEGKDAILNNIIVNEHGCWIWQRGKIGKSGYGKLHGTTAHREAWRLFVGDIPPGMYALHHCDVPSCVNPAHLFLGTQKENLDDMTAKGRARRGEGGIYNRSLTHCRRGHEFTPENTAYRKNIPGRICKACRRGRYAALPKKPGARKRSEIVLEAENRRKEIVERIMAGVSMGQVAAEFGVSKATVSQALKRATGEWPGTVYSPVRPNIPKGGFGNDASN